LGEQYFTLLEVAVVKGTKLSVGTRIYVGSGQRNEVAAVLGRIDYRDITQLAKDNLPAILDKVVTGNEEKYVRVINSMGLLTPRLHAFELLPGIGKSTTRKIIEERERGPFASFDDFSQRTRISNLGKVIVARIVEEISGEQKYRLFVR